MTRSDAVSVPQEQGIHIERSVTVDRPVGDLYAFWRDPTNFPQVFQYVESVEIIGNDRAHWKIKLPGGMTAEFDAEVYTDVPNEVVSWRSLPGSQLQNAGSVRFTPAPADRGTEVKLTLEFVPPGGALGRAVLSFFKEAPEQYVGQYLREFKRIMETGETATNTGQTARPKDEVQS